MPQILYPSTDTTIGSYTDEAGGTTDIYQSIDETTVDDADYIKTPQAPYEAVYVTKLTSGSDPAVSTDHVIRVWAAKDSSNPAQVDLVVELRQGYTNEASPGTFIAKLLVEDVDSVLTEYTYGLTTTETDAITDYTSLYYRFIYNPVRITPTVGSLTVAGAAPTLS